MEFPGVLVLGLKNSKECNTNLWSFLGWSFVFSWISSGKIKNLKIPVGVFKKVCPLLEKAIYWKLSVSKGTSKNTIKKCQEFMLVIEHATSQNKPKPAKISQNHPQLAKTMQTHPKLPKTAELSKNHPNKRRFHAVVHLWQNFRKHMWLSPLYNKALSFYN